MSLARPTCYVSILSDCRRRQRRSRLRRKRRRRRTKRRIMRFEVKEGSRGRKTRLESEDGRGL
jgi:hypothetical protein